MEIEKTNLIEYKFLFMGIEKTSPTEYKLFFHNNIENKYY